ncbi:MAG: winged helix-turn-helix domain-containing protein [Ahniella sp.]|nr:winged helix-turn-helix domain-containing protein [Ahniella sp.]
MRYQFGGFELDTNRELLTGPDGPVALRPGTFRMLRHLIERAPALVTRDELMDALWGHHALSPNVVPQTVSELRQALGDDAQEPRYIETRHRRGYCFVAKVEQVPDGVAEAAVDPELFPSESLAVVPSPQTAALPWITQPLWQFVLVGLAVLGLLVFWLRPDSPASAGTESRAGPALTSGRLWLQSEVSDEVLDAYLNLRVRSSSDWIHWPFGSGVSGAGVKPWRLVVDAQGAWQLWDDNNQMRSLGQLPAADLPSRAQALMSYIEIAAGRTGLAAAPIGWPRDISDRIALAEAAHAQTQGRLNDALAGFERADTDQGWPRYFYALALAEAGSGIRAMGVLDPLRTSKDQTLELLAEFQHARLSGRPNEALAALRAYTLLVPEAIGLRLELLDAQLAQAQWTAATDSMNGLAALLGDAAPALVWRRAQWLSVMEPSEADQAFRDAISLVSSNNEPDQLEQARHAYLRWLLARNHLDRAAKVIDDMPPDQVDTLLFRARLALARGDIDKARQDYQSAEANGQQQGRLGTARYAQLGLIEVALRACEAQVAADLANPLINRAQAEGDDALVLQARDVLGRAHTSLGAFDAAREQLNQTIESARNQGNARAEALARYHLGNVYAQERRQPEEAEQAYRLAADSFRLLREDLLEVKALANLALMAERHGRLLDARAAYQVALARVRELEVPHELGRIAFNVGVNERELGDLGTAAARFDEAMAAFEQTGMVEGVLRVASARADLAVQQGAVARARTVLANTELRRASVPPLAQSNWLSASARCEELAGNPTGAGDLLAQARQLRQQSGIRAAEVDLELRTLRLALVRGEPVDLLRFERIEAEFQRLGEPKYALSAAIAMVEASLLQGRIDAARTRADALRTPVQTRGNRAQQLQLDWLLALTSAEETRLARLEALESDAAKAGFGLLVRRVRYERLPSDSPERSVQQAELERDGLGGLLRSPLSPF